MTLLTLELGLRPMSSIKAEFSQMGMYSKTCKGAVAKLQCILFVRWYFLTIISKPTLSFMSRIGKVKWSALPRMLLSPSQKKLCIFRVVWRYEMSRNENLFYLFGSEEVAFKFFTPNLGILTIFRMRGVLVFKDACVGSFGWSRYFHYCTSCSVTFFR